MSGAIDVTDARPRGFFMVDNAIIREHGKALGPYGISVYAALCMYADRGGKCTPSYLTVAADLGISRRQVMREVDKIIALGLARADSRPDGRGKLHQTNVYTLLPVGVAGSDTQSLGVVTHSHSNKTHKNKTQEQEEPFAADAAPHPSPMSSTPSAVAVIVESPGPPRQPRKPRSAPLPPGYGDLFVAIRDACRFDARVIAPRDAKNVAAAAKRMARAEVQPAEVRAAAARWYADDWRGKQGQAPTVAQFETWLSTCRTAAPVPVRPGTQPAVRTWKPADPERVAAFKAKVEAGEAERRRKAGLARPAAS